MAEVWVASAVPGLSHPVLFRPLVQARFVGALRVQGVWRRISF